MGVPLSPRREFRTVIQECLRASFRVAFISFFLKRIAHETLLSHGTEISSYRPFSICTRPPPPRPSPPPPPAAPPFPPPPDPTPLPVLVLCGLGCQRAEAQGGPDRAG